MREFKKLPLELFIGYDIEQNSRVIELDASEMVEQYPSGILQLVCKRPGEETTYIAPSFEQDGGTLRWTLTSYDVEKAGQGLAIVALVDTSEESVKVLASHKIRTGIEEGLHFRDAEQVDPEDSLIARVLAAVSQAQAYAQDAAAALEDVQEEHDQAISAIETKGAETLASIPADYTTLSGDVSDLKSAIDTYLVPQEKNYFISSIQSFTLVRSSKRTIKIYLDRNMPSGNITLSFYFNNVRDINVVGIDIFDSSAARISSHSVNVTSSNRASVSFSSNVDLNSLYFYIQSTAVETATISIYNIQLEYGASATDYWPPKIIADFQAREDIITYNENIRNDLGEDIGYIESMVSKQVTTTGDIVVSKLAIPLSKISVSNANATKIIHTGKNILNASDFIISIDGVRARVVYPTISIPHGTYTISFSSETNDYLLSVIQVFDINGNMVASSYINSGINNITFTSDESIRNVYFYIPINAESGTSISISDFQLEYGDTATEYEAYEEELFNDTTCNTSAYEGTNTFWSDSGQVTVIETRYIPKTIDNIEKTSTDGLTDTYTITYTDGSTYNYTVKNGATSSAEIKDLLEDLLEEHTEWVTTVTDGAITESKVNQSFLPYIKNVYVTPEMFGAKGDGTTDDTDAIQSAINYSNTNKIGLMFSTGKVYAITSISLLNDFQSIDFSDCIFKALSASTMITIAGSENKPHGYVRNLTLDMNNIAIVGIGFTNCWRKTISDIQINNAPNNGIGIYVYGTLQSNGKSGGNLFMNLRGRTYNPGATFIDISAGDNTFSNIDWINYTTGIAVRAWSTLSNIHGFIGGDDFYPGSSFMSIYKKFMGVNLYPDTQEAAFYFESNGDGSILTNVFTCFNTSAVSDELRSSNPPICFKVPSGSAVDILSRTMVTGLYFDNSGYYDGENIINLSPYSMKILNVSGKSGASYVMPSFAITKNTDLCTYDNGGYQTNGAWVEKVTLTKNGVQNDVIGSNGYHGLKFIPGCYPTTCYSNGEYIVTHLLVSSNLSNDVLLTESIPLESIIYVNIPNVESL